MWWICDGAPKATSHEARTVLGTVRRVGGSASWPSCQGIVALVTADNQPHLLAAAVKVSASRTPAEAQNQQVRQQVPKQVRLQVPTIVTRPLVDAATLVRSGLGGSALMAPARIYVTNVQLREHRLSLNLTLKEVAEALIALAWERFAVRVGVNAGMVGKWERERSGLGSV
jgi:hypothetical protein